MTAADLDIEHLVHRMGLEDEDEVHEVVNFFLETAEPRLAELFRAVASRDAENTRHHAHAAKGAAKSVGAEALAGHLIAIETGLAEQRWPDIDAHTEQLGGCLERVRAALDSWTPDFKPVE